MIRKNIIVAIYSHAELYPPTLSAVHELAKLYDNVILLQRSHLSNEWIYPDNVTAISHGKRMSSRDQERSSIGRKLVLFTGFTLLLLKAILRYKPHAVLLFDYLALFSYHRIRRWVRKPKIVWYHNHDVVEINRIRKYSISWMANQAQQKAFEYLDVFSLPAEERIIHFPMDKFKGKYFFLPNYPLAAFYSKFYVPKTIPAPIRIVFQGQVSDFHGLEEIIELLNERILGHELRLIIKGPCQLPYREKLERLAEQFDVTDKVEFIGVTAYAEVPKVSAVCHIGIGIHGKTDVMNTTLGTASNKLYEYAAVGLPVLYYDSPHFRKHLSHFSWAFPVKLESSSIAGQIKEMISQYEELSKAARNDFLNNLNYEMHFFEIGTFMKASIQNSEE